jgi:hypothetical protein
MTTPDIHTADTAEKIFIGRGDRPRWLTLGLADRHGLVTGATATGKTVSLQVMYEELRKPVTRSGGGPPRRQA